MYQITYIIAYIAIQSDIEVYILIVLQRCTTQQLYRVQIVIVHSNYIAIAQGLILSISLLVFRVDILVVFCSSTLFGVLLSQQFTGSSIGIRLVGILVVLILVLLLYYCLSIDCILQCACLYSVDYFTSTLLVVIAFIVSYCIT